MAVTEARAAGVEMKASGASMAGGEEREVKVVTAAVGTRAVLAVAGPGAYLLVGMVDVVG